MDDRILGDLGTGANGFVSRSHCAEWLWQEHAIQATVNSANVWIVDFEQAIVVQIDSETDWTAALGMESDSNLFTPRSLIPFMNSLPFTLDTYSM